MNSSKKAREFNRNGSLNFPNVQGHIYYKNVHEICTDYVNIGVINTRPHCKTSAGAAHYYTTILPAILPATRFGTPQAEIFTVDLQVPVSH